MNQNTSGWDGKKTNDHTELTKLNEKEIIKEYIYMFSKIYRVLYIDAPVTITPK